MAAGVGPSSTVARQTPVRKHVAGDSDALIRATTRIPDGFFYPLRRRRVLRVWTADSSSLLSSRAFALAAQEVGHYL